jgi:hypothetical protein
MQVILNGRSRYEPNFSVGRNVEHPVKRSWYTSDMRANLMEQATIELQRFRSEFIR